MALRYPRAFFDAARASLFHGLTTRAQVDGINAILSAWDKAFPAGIDVRFVAYALATAFHETAETMTPIPEIGHGAGRPYGRRVPPYDQAYYGRGLVQLTWDYNYHWADTELHASGILKPSESLMKTPDLALRFDCAAAIMIVGMIQGRFTKRKLADYFTSHAADWFHAREIINGLDKAWTVASYGERFCSALTTGGWEGASTAVATAAE